MMKSNIRIFLGSIIVLALIGAVIYGGVRWYKLSQYPVRFASIAVGDNKKTVIMKMGRPDMVQVRPHPLWCGAQNCDSEFMYGQSIPPQWWVVGFNRDGTVVCTMELQSP
jgi:hypothetical protein